MGWHALVHDVWRCQECLSKYVVSDYGNGREWDELQVESEVKEAETFVAMWSESTQDKP